MKKLFLTLIALVFVSMSFASNPVNKGLYVKRKRDKVLKKLMDENKEAIKKVKDKREKYLKAKKEEKKKEPKRKFVVDFSNVKVPQSPAVFKSAFHFKPVAQYLTGTCWAFSGTSFYESEIYRITGKKIKLSEMYTVYWEYIEKAKGFVKSYGTSVFDEGSELDAVNKIFKKYGCMPESVYDGLKDGKKMHNHGLMVREMKAFLQFVKDNDLWDEDYVVKNIKLILDKYIGTPPSEFEYNGKKYTPKTFLKEVCKLKMDEYYDFVSFEYAPFYKKIEFKVPDNWRHSKDYYNVPLNVWYSILLNAVKKGYTAGIGGDVTEPGYRGEYDAAIVADFDIPANYINQDAREFRFYNHTTTDDHGIHLVGWTHYAGHDWFLIKDSSRSARKGKFEGYLFYRDDYVKLKMLDFVVHRSAIDPEILKKFEKTEKKK